MCRDAYHDTTHLSARRFRLRFLPVARLDLSAKQVREQVCVVHNNDDKLIVFCVTACDIVSPASDVRACLPAY